MSEFQKKLLKLLPSPRPPSAETAEHNAIESQQTNEETVISSQEHKAFRILKLQVDVLLKHPSFETSQAVAQTATSELDIVELYKRELNPRNSLVQEFINKLGEVERELERSLEETKRTGRALNEVKRELEGLRERSLEKPIEREELKKTLKRVLTKLDSSAQEKGDRTEESKEAKIVEQKTDVETTKQPLDRKAPQAVQELKAELLSSIRKTESVDLILKTIEKYTPKESAENLKTETEILSFFRELRSQLSPQKLESLPGKQIQQILQNSLNELRERFSRTGDPTSSEQLLARPEVSAPQLPKLFVNAIKEVEIQLKNLLFRPELLEKLDIETSMKNPLVPKFDLESFANQSDPKTSKNFGGEIQQSSLRGEVAAFKNFLQRVSSQTQEADRTFFVSPVLTQSLPLLLEYTDSFLNGKIQQLDFEEQLREINKRILKAELSSTTKGSDRAGKQGPESVPRSTRGEQTLGGQLERALSKLLNQLVQADASKEFPQAKQLTHSGKITSPLPTELPISLDDELGSFSEIYQQENTPEEATVVSLLQILKRIETKGSGNLERSESRFVEFAKQLRSELEQGLQETREIEQGDLLKGALESIQKQMSSSSENPPDLKRFSSELNALRTLESLFRTQETLNQLNPVMQALGEPAFILFPFVLQGFLSKIDLALYPPLFSKPNGKEETEEELNQEGEQEEQENAKKRDKRERIHFKTTLPSLGNVEVDFYRSFGQCLLQFNFEDSEVSEFVRSQSESLEAVLNNIGFTQVLLQVKTEELKTPEKPDWPESLAMQGSFLA